MLSNHGAQILRAVGASIRKFLGGSHHQMVNLPMTSVMELRDHRMAIAASFAFPREISSSVFRDFFDSIGQVGSHGTFGRCPLVSRERTSFRHLWRAVGQTSSTIRTCASG